MLLGPHEPEGRGDREGKEPCPDGHRLLQKFRAAPSSSEKLGPQLSCRGRRSGGDGVCAEHGRTGIPGLPNRKRKGTGWKTKTDLLQRKWRRPTGLFEKINNEGGGPSEN